MADTFSFNRPREIVSARELWERLKGEAARIDADPEDISTYYAAVCAAAFPARAIVIR